MKNPWLEVEVLSLPITEWLKRELPSWATRTRFHARTLAHEDTLVLAATCSFGDVGYAIFDKHLSHLHYMETREDCSSGVAEQMWARVLQEAAHSEITAAGNTEDGERCLVAWASRRRIVSGHEGMSESDPPRDCHLTSGKALL